MLVLHVCRNGEMEQVSEPDGAASEDIVSTHALALLFMYAYTGGNYLI